MLLDALPSLAYRDNLQMAEFMATVLNIMGGKPDPADKDTKLVPPERMYTSEDTIVWFAKEPKVSKWTPASARVALEHRDRLPVWARDSMPWSHIEALTQPPA